MTNKRLTTKPTLTALALSFLVSSSWTMAANYDPLDQQQSNINRLNSLNPLPDESTGSGSILQSLQQARRDSKKDSYFELFKLLQANKLEEAEKKIAYFLKQRFKKSVSKIIK